MHTLKPPIFLIIYVCPCCYQGQRTKLNQFTLAEKTMLNIPQPLAIAVDRIHPDTLPGYVHLKVIDLDNQVMFYQQAIGLQLNLARRQQCRLGHRGQGHCPSDSDCQRSALSWGYRYISLCNSFS